MLESQEARRPRNDKRRARNHEALLTAAIDIAQEDGAAALTPLRITERAGLHKPAFYAHFKTVDDCVQAIAVRIVQQNTWREDVLYREAFASLPPDRNKLVEALELTLHTALASPALYRLVLRCRYDDSELGRTVRDIFDKMCVRWTDVLWDLALRLGVGAEHLREVAVLAERNLEYQLVAIWRVVDGRENDLRAEAMRHERYVAAINRAEFERMLRSTKTPQPKRAISRKRTARVRNTNTPGAARGDR
jgi:AcrR family transcriptional regulator